MRRAMSENNTSINQVLTDLSSFLMEIQKELEEFFTLLQINCKEKIISIKAVPIDNIKNDSEKLNNLLNTISEKTKKISSEKTLTTYMECGEILRNINPLLISLISLLSSNILEFYYESHRLLKFFWAIPFLLARFELDYFPNYRENQLFFFNIPDALFNFLQELKEGPKPVEILAEMDIELRINKLLPILLSRTPDQIALSNLGEQYLKVHAISEYYYYYLYDFEDEILQPAKTS